MKAMVIDEFGDTGVMHFEEMPLPKPADNEVLIKIFYSAVNPVDWKIREGHFKTRMPHEFPIILGWDAAGTITAVGKNVKNLKIGDEVFAYCRKPVIQWGTYAEYIAFDAQHVAIKPKNINFSQAASIPLVGLTAWQALFDFAKLKKGETILIHGGAGGVGGLAIEFAKNAGAKVLTTASPDNHGYVKKLGADIAIDYHQDFVPQVKSISKDGVDVVFDTIGGKTLKDSLEILKPTGRIVSIVEQLDSSIIKEKKINFGFVFVSPNGQELKQIANLIEQGKIIIPNIEEMSLSEAPKAHEKISKGHTRGKIVLKVN